jgi:hypothetical protein
LACLLVSGQAGALQGWCGATVPASADRSWLEKAALGGERASLATTLTIPVAFHVITDGRNGKIPRASAQVLIDNLNWSFRDTPLRFRLHKFDTTTNKAWYNNCVASSANQNKLRKRLALDPRYYLNAYSCKLGQPGLLGLATFPPDFFGPGVPALNHLQGVAVDPIVLGSADYPYGLALAHEVGHYLGLFHTFETAANGGNACGEPGDFVVDTPAQSVPSFGECPIGRDTCIDAEGPDDIPNFMNYALDTCWEHFTPGQITRLHVATATFRPLLGSR